MSKAIVLANEKEAREITDRIKNKITEAGVLILDMYEREGWRALGYESWKDYTTTEFNIGQSRAYQLLNHGKVVKNIIDSTIVESTPTNEGQTRPLAKLTPEQQPVAWQAAQKETGKAQPPGKAVKEAVDEVIGFPKQAQVNKGKGTKQSVSVSGGSWGSGAGIDAEFEQGGEQSPGAAGFTLEELQTLLAEYDNGDQCPYCGK